MMTPQRVREDLVRSTVRSTLSRTNPDDLSADHEPNAPRGDHRRSGLVPGAAPHGAHGGRRRANAPRRQRADGSRRCLPRRVRLRVAGHRHAGGRTAGGPVHRREPEGPRADRRRAPASSWSRSSRMRVSAWWSRRSAWRPIAAPMPGSCRRRCSRTWRRSTARSCRRSGCRTPSPGTATGCSCSSGRSPTPTSPGEAAPLSPCSTRPSGSVSGGSAAQQLEAARAALRNMELRLKPEHPDIARMRRLDRDARAEGRERGARSAADGRRPGAASTKAEIARADPPARERS